MLMMLASGRAWEESTRGGAVCEESRRGRADVHDARLGPGKSRHEGC